MDKLKNKFKQLEKALKSWKESLDAPFTDLNRDAAIKRYEFSFELLWKTVKIYLKEIEGIELNSPKSVLREIRTILDISEKNIETCMKMADDRNLSVHTYDEDMADILYNSLKNYYAISVQIAKKIKRFA